MGRKNKRYRKDLHQQTYEKLESMQCFGQSKHEAMRSGGDIEGKIYSYSTYQAYKKHINYFTQWIQRNHPECGTLKASKKYVNEWLQSRVDEGLSAWTVALEQSALNKLYGISLDDPNRFQAPKRERRDIKRSRLGAKRDRNFSVSNNQELIEFCRGVGVRRSELKSLKGSDLMTREDIKREIQRIESVPERMRGVEDRKLLAACRDAEIFKRSSYFVHVRSGKGGRKRISPVVGDHEEQIAERFRKAGSDKPVWLSVNSNIDIHSYRSEYAGAVYKMYARPIAEIPYDRYHPGIKKMVQAEVYSCRKDRSGEQYDRAAMTIASKALGHNRVDVIANNYLRNL